MKQDVGNQKSCAQKLRVALMAKLGVVVYLGVNWKCSRNSLATLHLLVWKWALWYMTNTPAGLHDASVLSHDSVRIVLLVSSLNRPLLTTSKCKLCLKKADITANVHNYVHIPISRVLLYIWVEGHRKVTTHGVNDKLRDLKMWTGGQHLSWKLGVWCSNNSDFFEILMFKCHVFILFASVSAGLLFIFEGWLLTGLWIKKWINKRYPNTI